MSDTKTKREAPPKKTLPPATVRALRELMALGYPDEDIAEKLGAFVEPVRWYRRHPEAW